MSDASLLLACDMDGTVIPLDDGEEHRTHVGAFRRAVEGADGIRLAYVTGRHFPHALQGIEEHGLPLPDYLACEVGSCVRIRRGGDWDVDETYRRAMAAALGVDMDEVREALGGREDLELQPPAEQGEFKASWFAPWPFPEDLLDDVRARLEDVGARANLIASHDRATGRGLLDALPEGVAKDRAVLHLAAREGLTPDQVVYAGDSGNDRAAILSGVRAVLVGNAPGYLVEELRREVASRALDDRVHFARGLYAAGVLEGCRRFGVLGPPDPDR